MAQSLSTSVDLPAPGGPVTPMETALLGDYFCQRDGIAGVEA
jgi:hypothetical protein